MCFREDPVQIRSLLGIASHVRHLAVKSAAEPFFEAHAFLAQGPRWDDPYALKAKFQRLCLDSAGTLPRVRQNVFNCSGHPVNPSIPTSSFDAPGAVAEQFIIAKKRGAPLPRRALLLLMADRC